MNKQSKKSIYTMLAAIGAVGLLGSNANAFEIKNADMFAATVKVLVESGVITPLEQENWYQINRQRLNELMAQAESATPNAVGLIEMLKAIAGQDVNIREVELFRAGLGTQDFSVSQ